MAWIDLHTHSRYSDGTYTPAGLIDLAGKRKLAALALTDHDTMAGVAEFLAYAAQKRLPVLGGVEISAWHGERTVHILGYGLDHTDSRLLARLAELQAARHERNLGIFARLRALGIRAELTELDQQENGQIGRPHIARLLVRKKVVRTMHEAFSRFLKRGGAAYVESLRIHATEATRLVRDAGGLPMLAHPAINDNKLEGLPELLQLLIPAGLAGLEAYYPTHTTRQTKTLLRLAAEHDLLLCGGTDFHGDIRHGAPLGGNSATVRVPCGLFEQLIAALPRRT
ncbi:MAG: PHP domain-containing protein [Thermodesulfobacteriota bacterium]